MATNDQVQSLYIAYFGRPADSTGLTYWTTGVGAETDLEDIADGFATTAEYSDTTDGAALQAIVNSFYVNLFGRDAEVAGLNYWVSEIQAGRITTQQVGLRIGQTAVSATPANSDTTAISSKIDAADLWTAQTGSTTDGILAYAGADGIEAGVNFLAPVVSEATVPTEAAVETSVAGLVGNSGVAGSYDLTVFQDVVDSDNAFQLATGSGEIEGTSTFRLDSGNQTVNATTASIAQGDTLTDSSVTDADVLNLNAGARIDTAGVAGANVATVANIETINYTVTNEAGAAAITGVAGGPGAVISGANTFTVSGTIAAAANTQIAFGQATGITTVDTTGLTGAANTSTLTVTASGVGNTITTGATNDTINGAAGSDVIDAGAGTNAVTVGNGTDTITHSAGATAVTLNGTGALTVTATAAGLVINSGAGVNTTSDASASTSVVTFNGNTGRDTYTAGGGGDTITGGAGSDTMTAGGGVDTFGTANNFGTVGSSTAASANALTAATVVASDTLTFAGGGVIGNIDSINGFAAGLDKMDVATANAAPTAVVGALAASAILANNTTYAIYGTYTAATGVFTVAAGYNAATANDALVVVGDGAMTVTNATGYQLLNNLGAALVATDFV